MVNHYPNITGVNNNFRVWGVLIKILRSKKLPSTIKCHCRSFGLISRNGEHQADIFIDTETQLLTLEGNICAEVNITTKPVQNGQLLHESLRKMLQIVLCSAILLGIMACRLTNAKQSTSVNNLNAIMFFFRNLNAMIFSPINLNQDIASAISEFKSKLNRV